jgi:hypothetical protein
VVNASFAGATTDIQKDGLFDVIGYRAYENSDTLSKIIVDLPDAVLVDLYGRPLNTSQPLYLLSGYRKTDFINTIARAIKDSKVFFRTFDPAELARFSTVQAVVDTTASAGVIVPFLEDHVDDAARHNIKSAIFFMVRDSFRRQKNATIADLRPESHQLSLFKDKLAGLVSMGLFDHTIASFWYFVILTELLLALKKELDFQAGRKSELMAEVFEIEKELTNLGVEEAGDFTARINRLASFILAEVEAQAKRKEPLTAEQLTNLVFRGGAGPAKRLLVKHSAKVRHLVFLFDNIDKGWASDGVDELDVKLVRLLLEALEKVRSDLAVEYRDFIFVVFLRNDVFELMVSETPDKGKAAIVRIDWTDRVKLKQLIHLRLRASLMGGGDPSFNEMWDRYFTATVGKRDTFEYFVDHCLMRLRFLIAIVENAIANAINRGHQKVEQDDCEDAVLQHSNTILNDFGYEIRDVSGATEKVLYSLVGVTEVITKGEVLDRFAKGGVTADPEKLFTYLLWYGVLGVVNAKNQIVTSGLNFTQNHRFEFATGVAAGAVE